MTAPKPARHLFVFGLGFSAWTLARDLMAEGWRVSGTSRDPEKRARLSARGVTMLPFDRDTPLNDPAATLSDASHILHSVPPDREGDIVLDRHGEAIAALGPDLDWFGYLSTTGVYGNHDGAWVGEGDARQPTSERGWRRVRSEDAWLAHHRDTGLPVHLFRLAGIYGPGRSAIDTVRAGRARRIDKPGQVFSRIHVEDIAAILKASIAQPNPGTAYNVCDDHPAPSHEIIRFACELLDVEPPPLVPFEDADLTPMARSFFGDNKRVRNDRIKHELGVRFRYPDYTRGLTDQIVREREGIAPELP